jgi:hypothetical protein
MTSLRSRIEKALDSEEFVYGPTPWALVIEALVREEIARELETRAKYFNLYEKGLENPKEVVTDVLVWVYEQLRARAEEVRNGK